MIPRTSHQLRLRIVAAAYCASGVLIASAAPNPPASIASQPEKPAPTSPPASPAQPDKPAQPAQSDPKPASDPSVDDLIKDMEKTKPEGTAVAPDPAPAPAAATKPSAPLTPSSPAATQTPAATAAKTARTRNAEPGRSRLVREGTFLVSRKGRLVRSASGEWTFAFDSGTSQQTGNDPTMTILPCEKLMAMEHVAEKHGDAVSFSLSGQVFVYNGRNFLLPTNYIVNRPNGDVRPLQ